jgi:glycosyltransferase involved in cell wall biosynthesis
MEHNKQKPFDDWVLYITNHFTHLVVEAQTASPRFHLARKLSEKGQKLLVYCPIGRHVGNPFRDFVTNLFPKKTISGNMVYLFPPLIVSPASVTTPLTLIMGTFFILTYLMLTRIKVAAQYSTTILVGSVAAVVKMRKKIPLVANYGDPDFARERGLARKGFKFCEDLVMTRRNAHAMIYVDEVVGQYIKDNFPVERMLFLPNGGYEAGFTPPASDSPKVISLKKRLGLEGKSTILYAGQLTAVYRLDILLSAAPFIISRVPNARFVIIGSGPTSRPLQQSVKEAHLEEYFVFPGSIPYHELSPYLVLSDLCIQLLNDWCMGTKVVMYMVHRKTVIAGGNWFKQYGKFLRNGENSILIPADVEVFGEATVKALLDPARRAKIGESAWITVRPYTWDEHADETLRLLKASVRG